MTPDDDLFAAPDVESPTAKLRAVPAEVSDPDNDEPAELTVGPGPLPAELSDPAIEPLHLAEPAPLGDMVASDDTAEILHSLACACPRIDDRPRHQGYDFHELGAALDARIQERLVERLLGEYILTPIGRGEPTEKADQGWMSRGVMQAARDLPDAPRHAAPAPAPVEAKVSAGAFGALAASLGVALLTALLDNLDLVPSIVGGDRPWVGTLVVALGVALPPLISLWRGYRAPHTPRDTP